MAQSVEDRLVALLRATGAGDDPLDDDDADDFDGDDLDDRDGRSSRRPAPPPAGERYGALIRLVQAQAAKSQVPANQALTHPVNSVAGPPATLPARPQTRRRRYDWDRAVALLAVGGSVGEVAAEIGCSRVSLWRALHRVPGLRHALSTLQARQKVDAGNHLLSQRQALVEALLTAALVERKPTVLLYLCKELGLAEFNHMRLPHQLQFPTDRHRRDFTDAGPAHIPASLDAALTEAENAARNAAIPASTRHQSRHPLNPSSRQKSGPIDPPAR
jgi:hypothetical protein